MNLLVVPAPRNSELDCKARYSSKRLNDQRERYSQWYCSTAPASEIWMTALNFSSGLCTQPLQQSLQDFYCELELGMPELKVEMESLPHKLYLNERLVLSNALNTSTSLTRRLLDTVSMMKEPFAFAKSFRKASACFAFGILGPRSLLTKCLFINTVSVTYDHEYPAKSLQANYLTGMQIRCAEIPFLVEQRLYCRF